MTEEAPSIESNLQDKIADLERRIEELEKNLPHPSGDSVSASSGRLDRGEGSESQTGAEEYEITDEAKETFEIISVDSRAFERDVEGDRCKFSWKVVVKNHTTRPLILRARLEFVDMDSYLVEEDSATGFRLEAGDEGKFRGYKWISNEAEYQIVGVRANLSEVPQSGFEQTASEEEASS